MPLEPRASPSPAVPQPFSGPHGIPCSPGTQLPLAQAPHMAPPSVSCPPTPLFPFCVSRLPSWVFDPIYLLIFSDPQSIPFPLFLSPFSHLFPCPPIFLSLSPSICPSVLSAPFLSCPSVLLSPISGPLTPGLAIPWPLAFCPLTHYLSVSLSPWLCFF